MICKECGAYNSDSSTYCRVCSAKLTEDEPAVSVEEETPAENAPSRPGRKFSQMPTWSKEAFTGASAAASARRTFAPAEQTEEQTEAGETVSAPAAAAAPAEETAPAAAPAKPAFTPAAPAEKPVFVPSRLNGGANYSFKPTIAVPEDKEPELCPNCGNRLLADTPYCPYCGKRVRTDIEPAASIHVPAETPSETEEKPEKTEPTEQAVKTVTKSPRTAEFFDDEDDDEYDDYDGDDEEFDEEDEEDTPRKGGSSAIFWILIVVLVLLIGGIAFFLLRTNGGFSGIKSLFGGKETAAQTETVSEASETTETLVTEETTESTEPVVSIEPCVLDSGENGFMLDVTAPAGTTVHVITTAALKSDKAQIGTNGRVQIKVPESIFIPDDYCESEQVSVTPNVELIYADGTTQALNLPDISVTVPVLSLTLTNPTETTVEENRDGSDITVSGTVSDGYAELTVNGKATTVYDTLEFSTAVSQEEERANGGIIVVELKKKGCATARTSITVTEYVVKDIDFTVASEDAVLCTDRATNITGTVTPGATITVTAENTVVTCGTPVVSAIGNYSIPVTLSEDGIYTVTVKAELEGYNTKELVCRIAARPEKLKTFKAICSDMADVYDAAASGELKEQNVVLNGTVEELVKSDEHQIVKISLGDEKYVYVINYSEKKTYSSKDIGKKIEITGSLTGLYEDTAYPQMWGWFATIK